ncbi:cadherin domain-containing protein [Candidatus Poribacteria bacterium]|nr:cadherin domain-containing protein [Candidatus Poribacteria bacterium]
MLLLARKYYQSKLSLLILFLLIPFTSSANITPVEDRTAQVRDAIVTAAGVESHTDVTNTHLAAITSLNLKNKGITELKSGDFSGMTGLENINLYQNKLSNLPDRIFEGLTALTTLRLGRNSVDLLTISVSLEKVGTEQIKAVVPTGAPFDIVLPISVINGSISGDATSLTVSKGSVESGTVSLSRTIGITDAVTSNIGMLPNLPINHYGYVLSKSDTLPLEIFGADSTPPVTPEPPAETETPTQPETTENTAPSFTDGSTTVRSIVENSDAAVAIGSKVSATDTEDNTLEYTLSGVDAASFDIVRATGQLQTKAALDYETKKVYIVTVTVSDGNLTDSISVIISVIDVDETPFVSTFIPVSERTSQVQEAILEALPSELVAADVTQEHLSTITSLSLRNSDITELKTGDFSGLNKLTSLNLFGNMLEGLPTGIFDGLTALTSLRLGGNSVDPMPLIVALQQVAENQYQAVVHTGAPFNIVLPIEVNNGMISDGSTDIVIQKGSVKSGPFTVTSTTGEISVEIGFLPSLPRNHFGYILAKSAVCNRTSQVADAITEVVPGATDCNNVTDVDLALITSLDLSDMSITSLRSDDFYGLISLTSLNLSNNQLDSLPDGIFSNLTGLTDLDLSGNSVDPFPLTLSLLKTGDNQFKVVAPIGAPFDIVLPISIANGSLSDSISTVSILQGNTESINVSVTRIPDTSDAVTVDLGTLPNLPATHSGYSLVKSNQVPLEIFPSLNVAPVFTDGESTTRYIAERTVANVNIGDAVSATDDDGDTLTYTLSGTDAASFTIDSTNGQLKTMVDLDYEKKTSYSVTISVSDSILSDSISVTIKVTDIDDNRRPVFTEGDSATRIVAENTVAGVDIGSPVSATDPDQDILTYTLSGTDASSFTVDSRSGQIRTNGALDYETKASYAVTLTVSDSEYSESIEITINITDLDETGDGTDTDDTNTDPVFTEGDSATRSIAENTGSGVDIGNAVSATDADENPLTYSLGGTDASSFSIDSTSGQLRTKGSLDYETKSSYSLTVSVSDGNEGSDTITITINITDVDETVNTPPVFTDGVSVTRSISENTGSGVDIGTVVSATDPDEDTLSYSLGGTDASSFSIDSSSGQLRTKASLDYETKSSYSVTVSVSDEEGGSASITVTINITDIDESPANNAPVFTDGTNTTRTIPENTSSNVNIGNAISATDDDDDTVSYSLDGTDASSFSIDSSSGQLRTSSSLDYETKSSYSVTVSASDGQGGSTSISVTINITNVNEAPVFTDGTSTTRSIAENASAGINIGSVVSATDVDSTNLTYTLGGTDAASFSIESTTGQLKTKTALDYETKISFSVTITVSDGSLTDSIAVTINVRDLDETPSNIAPVFTDGEKTTRSIAENTAANTNIGRAIAATDEDSENLAYLLSGTDASVFTIDGTTGQLKTSAALNFETKNTYTVTVTVSDGSLKDEITVTINVTNVNEAPEFAPDAITREVAENTEAGTNLGSAITATDPDANDTIAYSLSGTDAASFDIVSTSGQLKTKTALDYETKTSYSVIVTATDSEDATDTIPVTINITDVDENRQPIFPSETTTRSVAENTGAGVNIGDPVSATDLDTNDTLEYSLGGTDSASFDIGSTNGQLRTKAALDYETKMTYSLTVSVSDGNGGTDSIMVTINVTDVLENTVPSFSTETTTRSIPENTGSGVNIGDPVSATDPDTDDTLEYSLGGTDSASFSINSTNGQLRTNAVLDYETKASYSVTVSVSDGNGGSDSITVSINITNVNEKPAFTDTSPTKRLIAENTATNQNIGSAVSATDPDSGDSLTYGLGGTDAASFSIDSNSGQLKTRSSLDHEDDDTYTVIVTVSDRDNLSASITVNISITDVNEAPSFTDGTSTTRSVAENTASGENIGSVVAATDPEEDSLTYTLGGTDASSFNIVSTSGQLQTKGALDYETTTSYSVTITVSDDSLTDTITVTINVTDVNENRAPSFANSSFTIRITDISTVSAGDSIGTAVTATDPDDNTLSYSLGGDDADNFTIDSNSGQIKATQDLIDDTSSSYSIKVIADDGNTATAEISGTVYVTRKATQITNNAPVFDDGDSTTRSVPENTASGANIGDPITATDVDTDDILTYSLEGTDASSFSIVSSSGQIQTGEALDYDTKNTYSVTVKVEDDSGASNNSDTISVTINVTAVTEDTTITAVSDRTETVRDAIVDAIDTIDDAANVTETHLSAITSLDIGYKGLTTLLSGDFDGLTGLTSLDISGNKFSSLPVNIFEDLTSLTHLEISFNNFFQDDPNGLTTLPDGIFDNLSSLIELNLGFSGLTSLPDGIFDKLSSLETLDLVVSEFTTLSADVFDGLSSLKSLDLTTQSNETENQLTSIPSGLFDDLTALEILYLSGHSFSSLPTGLFDKNTTLTTLHLFNNGITTIPDGIFDKLTSLTRLFFHGNNLPSLSDGIFDKNTLLEHLDIRANRISSLRSDVFDTLTNLRILSLRNNMLTSLSADIFDQLTNLTSLYLQYNKLTALPSNIFDNNTNITTLNITSNNISSLPSGLFSNLTNLTGLYLDYNNITSFPDGLFVGLTQLTYFTCGFQGENPLLNSIPIKAGLEKVDVGQFKVVCPSGLPFSSNLIHVSITNGAIPTEEDSTYIVTAENGNPVIKIPVGESESDAIDVVRLDGTTEAVTVTINTALFGVSLQSYGYYFLIDNSNLPLELIPAVSEAPNNNLQIPEHTALLTNFPNPFNPETWIPYQLSKASDVTMTICNIQGVVVRELVLGYQPAGYYRSRAEAAYWDGRNSVGEKVSTGVYFYTFKTSNFEATRRMLIIK